MENEILVASEKIRKGQKLTNSPWQKIICKDPYLLPYVVANEGVEPKGSGSDTKLNSKQEILLDKLRKH